MLRTENRLAETLSHTVAAAFFFCCSFFFFLPSLLKDAPRVFWTAPVSSLMRACWPDLLLLFEPWWWCSYKYCQNLIIA